MREEGPTGSRFCSGDLNLQSSGQKSCRQWITDLVRHVQMKLEPPGRGSINPKVEIRNLERSPKPEIRSTIWLKADLRFGLRISSRLAGFRASGFVPG